VISKVNAQFKDNINGDQFVVTPLPPTIYRGAEGQPLMDVALSLYEYPVASAAEAHTEILAACTRGALPLPPSPDKLKMRRVGSREALSATSPRSAAAASAGGSTFKRSWPVLLAPVVEQSKGAGPISPPTGKKVWK
jgi:hypothetical protein